MIRIQVRLTEEQVRALRRQAAQQERSLAALVRQSITLYLARDPRRLAAALEAAGKFSSGSVDGSSDHDRYLADAYRD
jgi:hypothetical protein